MLTVLLFNSIGYRIVSTILANRSDAMLDAKIAAESIDESQLVEIRIPLNLPYHTAWNDFERHTGEVEVNGRYYKYVKRKVIVDSLILLCLPNNDKSMYESSRDKIFKLVNNLKSPLEKNVSSIYKNIISDYLQKDNTITLSVLPIAIKLIYSYNLSFFSKVSLEKPVKPPEA